MKYLKTIGYLIPLLFFINPLYSRADHVKLVVEFTGSSFEAKSTQLTGSIVKKGTTLTATRIALPVSSLKTGIALRDRHLQQQLSKNNSTEIVLSSLVAQNGAFTADLTLNGVTRKKIEGEYELKGNQALATFTAKISEFKIPPITYLNGSIEVEDEVSIEVSIKTQ